VKKFISAAFILFMAAALLSPGALASNNYSDYIITNRTPDTGSYVPGDWDDIETYYVNGTTATIPDWAAVKEPGDLTLEYKFLWDEDHLYILEIRNDSSFSYGGCPTNPNELMWMGDCTILWFNPAGSMNDWDIQFSAGTAGEPETPSVRKRLNSGGSAEPMGSATTIYAERSANQTIIIIALSWDDFGIAPDKTVEGSEFRFGLVCCKYNGTNNQAFQFEANFTSRMPASLGDSEGGAVEPSQPATPEPSDDDPDDFTSVTSASPSPTGVDNGSSDNAGAGGGNENAGGDNENTGGGNESAGGSNDSGGGNAWIWIAVGAGGGVAVVIAVVSAMGKKKK